MHSLEVECFPRDLPDVIRLDVSALGVGQSLHVRDIELPAGVAARGDHDLTVVRVTAPITSEATPTGAEAAVAQPEVIKEKKAEEKESK